MEHGSLTWRRRTARRFWRAGACVTLLAWTAGCHLGDLFGSGAVSRNDPELGERLVFTVEPGNVRAGDTIVPAVQVTVIDSLGAVSTEFSGAVTLVLVSNPGTGTLSGRLTRDVLNGAATFPDLSIDQPGTRYRLTASAAGLASVTSVPFDVIDDDDGGREPTTLAAVSGDGQRDTVAATLDDPYVVRVTDAEGQPVPGVTVAWSVTDGDGMITPTSSLTGNDGQTIARHRLGTSVGPETVTAAVDGLAGSPATFTATATHGAPTQLAFTTQPANTAVDEPISPPVQVAARDQFGNGASSWAGTATVSLAANPGDGTLSGTLTRTAEAGVVPFPGLSIDQPGNGYRLRVAADGLTAATSGTFTVTDGGGGGGEPTALTRVSGDGQTGTVGEPLDADYVVRVTDANGDPVAGVMITWTVTAGGGSVSPTASTTDGNGRAGTRHRLGTGTGTHSVQAAASGLSPVTFSSTGTHAPATELEFTVQPSDADVDEPITPAVEVTAYDQYGNRATSFSGAVNVAISSNPGGGSLSGTTSRNASSGVATFPGLSIDEPGDGYRLSAGASGLSGATSSPFDVTGDGGGGGGEPTTLTRVSGDGQTGTVGEPLDADYVVRVTDASGDPVAGVTVTWTVTAGGGSVSPTSSATDGNGRATARHTLGTSTGTHSVRASVSGLSPVTFSSTATADDPAELVFTTQPSDAGAGQTISPPVRVTVRDQFGNTVTGFSGSITMSITPLTGTLGATLSGTLTRAVSNGVATFNDLSIDLVGVAYRLRATGAGLSEDSAAFNILL